MLLEKDYHGTIATKVMYNVYEGRECTFLSSSRHAAIK
jgi:hypothetical protein